MKEIEKLKKRNKGLIFIIVLLVILVGVMVAMAYNYKNTIEVTEQDVEDFLIYAINLEIYASERLGITDEQFSEDFLRYYSDCLITENCEILKFLE